LCGGLLEPGWERVRGLLHDETAVLGLPAPVLFEFQVRLQEKGVLAQHPETVAEYEALFDVALPVDNPVANAAFQLKRDTLDLQEARFFEGAGRKSSKCLCSLVETEFVTRQGKQRTKHFE